ncbi:deoxyuridine 5'-triphosphate nucleotidohydrolase [Bacillus licheniformis]|uniref:dUTP diphosphatase n=1 Tax=Bacillus TaxID=1386 RepID=UPI001D0E143C|nr:MULTISPECIES: deoxyuridine 5'-triphosphate nucleotidohydrolase [Bacillus]MCC2134104.1 deoxyuridine 5'-triphosphate nucleotidohydrolase [Bacillus licheniformis]MCC2146440.1 deoxyuridine 5'-triphosphate nucleotidohydrolase [Bacillus licheniformis]MCC2161931.1 deoxyuridine 5'-triphosphate nucleotidohydrolase [Bacillus licheniformis]MCC2187124.1 deoxyuridine 5'-triphosphate nucleotidohydrolase [Bacillus licheniformis]MCX2881330.1 deoxyuridine 5'-triphosphate nucleotidohydrolase [Bacillus sp. AR
MNVNIKRLSPDAQIPQYAHASDACFDLVAAEDVVIEPGETALVKTGLAFEIPEGYEMQIRPRSGITLKTKLRVQLGTVDAGYRGEVGVIVDNISPLNMEVPFDYGPIMVTGEIYRMNGDLPQFSYIIRKGDRIAQAVIKPVEQAAFTEVAELGDSDRGAGGFGSSGVGSPHPEYFGEPIGKERI